MTPFFSLPAGLIPAVLAVPDDYRRFDIDARGAARQYGISPQLLTQLLELGLPVRHHAGESRFAAYDLANISLHMGLPSIQRLAMRTWARTLQLVDAVGRTSASITIRPLAGTPASVATLCLPLQERAAAVYASGPLLQLIDEFAAYQFHMLPEGCRWRREFIETHRICECGGASRILVENALKLGLQARHCFGLLIAEPYSTGHYWAEFMVDDTWQAFDPLLLGLLHAVTRLSPAAWPVHRANSAALHRLCIVTDYDEAGTPRLPGLKDAPGLATPMIVLDDQAMIVSLPTVYSADTCAPQ